MEWLKNHRITSKYKRRRCWPWNQGGKYILKIQEWNKIQDLGHLLCFIAKSQQYVEASGNWDYSIIKNGSKFLFRRFSDKFRGWLEKSHKKGVRGISNFKRLTKSRGCRPFKGDLPPLALYFEVCYLEIFFRSIRYKALYI